MPGNAGRFLRGDNGLKEGTMNKIVLRILQLGRRPPRRPAGGRKPGQQPKAAVQYEAYGSE